MKRMGMCWKCLEWKEVRDHHAYGYETDETKPYCYSCDYKAHNKARRESRCNLTSDESNRESVNSYSRRSQKHLFFRETLAPNIRLYEQVAVNVNTGTITVNSDFLSGNGKKLCVIKES